MRRPRSELLRTRPLTVRAADGVRLSGIVVPAAPPRPPGPGARRLTFVVAHGFTNSVARAPFRRLTGWLRRFGEVRALDFCGHGGSGGGSGVGGDPEVLDVDAAVRSARDDVSAVSRWYVRDTLPMRRVHWLLETSVGRSLASRVVRLRLDEPWLTPPPSPLQVVSRIAPTPLLLVHGDRDEYFPLEHFRTLAQAAGPTATAWVVPGFGHAESGATAPLVERIGRWASATIGT